MPVLVIVVAVPLGLYVRKVHRRQDALEDLDKAGLFGRFDFECDEDGSPNGDESPDPEW